jgi:hypothetical protein
VGVGKLDEIEIFVAGFPCSVTRNSSESVETEAGREHDAAAQSGELNKTSSIYCHSFSSGVKYTSLALQLALPLYPLKYSPPGAGC